MARRRRYWLGLAWCGVVLLVVISALATSVSPWPFRFLGGSTRDEFSIETYVTPAGTTRILRSRFVIDETMDSVCSRARSELVYDDGWEWTFVHGMWICRNVSAKEQVVFSQSIKPGYKGPGSGPVVVFYTRRASVLDRVLVRLSRTPGRKSR
jgi:hypothetical protein